SVALLLAGTVHALNSYVSTMNTADSKLAELLSLDELKPAVSAVITPSDVSSKQPAVLPNPNLRDNDPRQMREKLAHARKIFAQYHKLFNETLARKRDPHPYQDTHLGMDIEKSFDSIDKAIDAFEMTPDVGFNSRDLSNNADLKKGHDHL